MPKKKRKSRRHDLSGRVGLVVLTELMPDGSGKVICPCCGELDIADFFDDPEDAFRQAEIDALNARMAGS